ncbi:MAG: dipicolinate synthase subunit DpsA [Clostridia bacterium]|nr:dipicolinate synthase subunit DpsA [Clostridia bacterium]
MNQFLTFAFIGGDLRQAQAITSLAKEGYSIRLFGLDKIDIPKGFKIYKSSSLEDCLYGADIIILPLPYSNGDDTIKTSLSDVHININELVRKIEGHQLLLAGKADQQLIALAKLYNVHLIDYATREEMAVKNSIPTVEGALEIAMRETPYTIHSSKCLVLGYGRIGKLLASSLNALGAKTHVAARKYSDLAWIEANGLLPIHFPDLYSHIGNFDIIFNTVPELVLDFKHLTEIKESCLIIDLASKPGGVDFEVAGKLGKKVIWALSLPGKVAPQTAGNIIKETIVNILNELGV